MTTNDNGLQNLDWFSHVAKRTLAQLNHSVDLYAVLRGQLWMEQDVLDLLRVGSPEENCKLGFRKMIGRARKRGLLDEADVTFLKALYKVRNCFAHELERETLTRKDDDYLFEASDETIRILYAGLTVEVEEPETSRGEGLRFRGLIAAMHVRLLKLIARLKVEHR